MQIVAVQLDMVWEDKPANHKRVLQLLDESEIEPGALILLPELFETGFSMNVSATAQSESRDGEQFLQILADKFEAAVMGGVAAPVSNGKSANQCVAYAPGGKELVRYQKMKPFSLSQEGRHYPAGKAPAIFSWQGVQIAPFICYDLRFPELFRQAVINGAELFTLIACWPAKRSEHWVRLLQARAIENLAVVAGVNRSGSEPGLDFDGRSSCFDHLGNCLFEASAEEQVLTTRVDLNESRRWRSKFPALRDMSESDF